MKVTENKICIFLVTYNRKKYLKYSLESVLNQSYGDFIITILDNCSTDGTEEYIESIKDERIKYIRHEKNIGGLANIAYAFEHCEGDYFAIFHDDDILHKNLLEEEIAYLKLHEECVAVSCLANIIDEHGNYTKINVKNNGKMRVFSRGMFFDEYINSQKNFVFPSTLYRTNFIKENKICIKLAPGPCADVVLYTDIEKKGGTIVEIPKVLIDYRIYKSQDSFAHLEDMLIQLIRYFSNDQHYGEMLQKNLKGRKRYLKWYFRRLLAREVSNCIDINAAQNYLALMNEVLGEPIPNINTYMFVLKTVGGMPGFSNLVYKAIKKVKKEL